MPKQENQGKHTQRVLPWRASCTKLRADRDTSATVFSHASSVRRGNFNVNSRLRPCRHQAGTTRLQSTAVKRSNEKPSDFYRKLDLVLARLEHIEQRLDQQDNSDKSDATVRSRSALSAKPQLLALHPQTRGIVKLNHQTGCFEYYGRCNNISLSIR